MSGKQQKEQNQINGVNNQSEQNEKQLQNEQVGSKEWSWKDDLEMKFYQIKAQNALMDNFQLLFLKKYDKLLTVDEKWNRDLSDWVVQGSSTIANVGSFLYILTQLSITNNLKFNPIRDSKVLLGGIAFMFAMRSAGILFMWNRNQDTYFRISPNIDLNEQVDFYANNTSNPLKIFLYRNFY